MAEDDGRLLGYAYAARWRALHEKQGMTQVAHFQAVGFKLGRWIDVGYWQKVLQ